MTYDEWKLMTPDEDADLKYGRLRRYVCDVCDRQVNHLHHVWAYGIETYACDACTGSESEDDE